VATIANISTLLISLNWHGGFLSEEAWTVAMIVVATLLGLFIAFTFKEPAFLLVLMWAFFGIYSRWAETDYELISNTARIAAITLAVMFGKLIVDSRKTSKV
jgi:inner membrane protein involved in colicin E2 resistance